MKIAVRSYGAERDRLDGFGGLELRYVVHWAHFLRSEGHEVHFFHENAGCDSSFDVALDAPRHACSHMRSKGHVHNWFLPFENTEIDLTEAHNNPCYTERRFVLSLPYRYGYNSALKSPHREKYASVVFLPLPYPDDLIPQGLVPGFQRKVIFWGNKGNFNPEFGPERNPHYIENGLNTLRALVKLNQRAEFTAVFALDSLIRSTRPEWRGEVESLIGQLKDVQRLDRVSWSQYRDIMGQTKINTHVGDLTSGINECLLVKAVPAASEGFIFFQDVVKDLKLMPAATVVTAEQIYDTYERLWFDKQHYARVSDTFQAAFEDHRTPALRRWWGEFLDSTRST